MSNSIDRIFSQGGQPLNTTQAGKACPSDEAFADYLGALLPSRERESLELHSLACADCHDLLRMVVDLASVEPQHAGVAAFVPVTRTAKPPVAVRIAVRLVQRTLELLNEAELAFRPLAPVSVVRGVKTCSAYSVTGPGNGIDEVQVHVQANGSAQLTVRCDTMPDLGAGELPSVLLDVDGAAREKRLFSIGETSFPASARGNYRVRVVARAPGGPMRPLAEATVELTA